MSIIYYAAQLGEPEQFLVGFFKLTKSDLNYIEADTFVSVSGKDGQVRHPGKQKICAAQLSG